MIYGLKMIHWRLAETTAEKRKTNLFFLIFMLVILSVVTVRPVFATIQEEWRPLIARKYWTKLFKTTGASLTRCMLYHIVLTTQDWNLSLMASFYPLINSVSHGKCKYWLCYVWLWLRLQQHIPCRQLWDFSIIEKVVSSGGEEQLSRRGFHLFPKRESPITPLFHFLSQGQKPNGHINNSSHVWGS